MKDHLDYHAGRPSTRRNQFVGAGLVLCFLLCGALPIWVVRIETPTEWVMTFGTLWQSLGSSPTWLGAPRAVFWIGIAIPYTLEIGTIMILGYIIGRVIYRVIRVFSS